MFDLLAENFPLVKEIGQEGSRAFIRWHPESSWRTLAIFSLTGHWEKSSF